MLPLSPYGSIFCAEKCDIRPHKSKEIRILEKAAEKKLRPAGTQVVDPDRSVREDQRLRARRRGTFFSSGMDPPREANAWPVPASCWRCMIATDNGPDKPQSLKTPSLPGEPTANSSSTSSKKSSRVPACARTKTRSSPYRSLREHTCSRMPVAQALYTLRSGGQVGQLLDRETPQTRAWKWASNRPGTEASFSG
jgi:hypothetical protein